MPRFSQLPNLSTLTGGSALVDAAVSDPGIGSADKVKFRIVKESDSMNDPTTGPPSDAGFFPASPVFPTVQAEMIAWLQTTVQHQNSGIVSGYTGACGQWAIVNSRNRDLGLGLTAKPTPPDLWTLHTLATPEGGIYFWQRQDGGPAGPPCPDLPPYITAPVVPPGTPVFGQQIPGTQWWACMPGDNVPNNQTVVITVGMTLPAGVTPPVGTYQKVPGMIGAWYLKVG
jgi:hypothetical protein